MRSAGGSLLPASGDPDSFGRNAPPEPPAHPHNNVLLLPQGGETRTLLGLPTRPYLTPWAGKTPVPHPIMILYESLGDA
jgi:hypothetical protein